MVNIRLCRIYLHVFIAFHRAMMMTKIDGSFSDRCCQVKVTALFCMIQMMRNLGFIFLIVPSMCWIFDLHDVDVFSNVCGPLDNDRLFVGMKQGQRSLNSATCILIYYQG